MTIVLNDSIMAIVRASAEDLVKSEKLLLRDNKYYVNNVIDETIVDIFKNCATGVIEYILAKTKDIPPSLLRFHERPGGPPGNSTCLTTPGDVSILLRQLLIEEKTDPIVNENNDIPTEKQENSQVQTDSKPKIFIIIFIVHDEELSAKTIVSHTVALTKEEAVGIGVLEIIQNYHIQDIVCQEVTEGMRKAVKALGEP